MITITSFIFINYHFNISKSGEMSDDDDDWLKD